jgi:hypothetical protein
LRPTGSSEEVRQSEIEKLANSVPQKVQTLQEEMKRTTSEAYGKADEFRKVYQNCGGNSLFRHGVSGEHN